MAESTQLLSINLLFLLKSNRIIAVEIEPSLEQLLGYPAEDFFSAELNFLDLIHADDKALITPFFSPKSSFDQSLNFRIRHQQGKVICVRGHFQLSEDSETKQSLVSVTLDYAKHLAKPLNSQILMNNFSVMMETSDDYIYFKDRNHVFNGASQTLVSVTDPSEHWTDLIGLTDYDVFPEEYADKYYKLEKMVFSGEITIAHEIQPTIDNEGRQGWVDNRKYPIKNEDGKIIGLFGIARDITALKQLQIAHEQKIRQLENSNKIFDEAGDPIALMTEDRFIDCNKATLHLLGFNNKQEFLNSTVSNICPTTLIGGQDTESDRLETLKIASEKGMYRFDWVNQRTDGSLIDTEVTITSIKIENQEVFHLHWRDITERKHLLKQIEWQATHDPLSKLPNRALLADRFDRAIIRSHREKNNLIVCVLDLDGFKQVNDTYGHNVGDQLIIQVANRLSYLVRGTDTVSRLGGDEFVLLLSGLEQENDVADILHRILIELAKPYDIEDHRLSITASLGVTSYPNDHQDADTLLRHADQAMYRAKQSGRNCTKWFDIESDQKKISSLETVNQVKQALESNQLKLYYQPKINAKTKEIVGMEALLRWEHPEKGLIPPLSFLPLVEQTDIIIDIGDWVLWQALDHLQQWLAKGFDWVVSVNIAARHFQRSNFEVKLKEIINQFPKKIHPHLEIELLESVAVLDINYINQLMTSCQNLGVKFALDDFGTGYSSLNYLKKLPAETLKIDQSFVRDILTDADALTIVKSVISLADHFNRKTIAEGVETNEHIQRLVQLGCDELQGYGIARPMPADDVVQWAENYNLEISHSVDVEKQL